MRLEHAPSNPEHLQFWPWLVRVINGGISFGDNIAGSWVSYVTNVNPDTQDTVPHLLKKAPRGFLIVSMDKAGMVYKSAAYDATNLHLKCNVASCAVTLFVIP
jgi:hypothetical protein